MALRRGPACEANITYLIRCSILAALLLMTLGIALPGAAQTPRPHLSWLRGRLLRAHSIIDSQTVADLTHATLHPRHLQPVARHYVRVFYRMFRFCVVGVRPTRECAVGPYP